MKAQLFSLLMIASTTAFAQADCVPSTTTACTYGWTLSWNASEGATYYDYQWKINGGKWSAIGSKPESPAEFQQAIKVNEKLMVRARACDARKNCSDWEYVNFVFKGLPPAKVTGLKIRRL